ncbi:regulatory protein GemA [Aporhodopirellula aestuarii]|uniref:Regulatory protein GemA n=1 Tax=Aporhodopirellula aestuarii TaxID=2950107 RepID=A0ABT0U4Q9_9BACT|nr:regulatory protein GemA [Aporhodopirellula aestuarii]MCM2371883.1 regulatory protein GemA [Aporhodopirellula aestuarii]
MTTKLSVGVTRKVGQPNFGSACATCQLEIEIDNSLMNDHADTLTERIRRTFDLCRQEVDRELMRHADGSHSRPEAINGNVRARNGSSPQPTQARRARPATDAQIRAIHAIASKANVRLASELDAEFGVASPQSLTLQQASELIEKLKSQLTGQ